MVSDERSGPTFLLGICAAPVNVSGADCRQQVILCRHAFFQLPSCFLTVLRQCVASPSCPPPSVILHSSIHFLSDVPSEQASQTTRISGARTDLQTLSKFPVPLTCFLSRARPASRVSPRPFVCGSATLRRPLPDNQLTDWTWPVGRHRSAYVSSQTLLRFLVRRECDANDVRSFTVDARVQEHHREPATIHNSAPLRNEHIRVWAHCLSESQMPLTQKLEDGTTSSRAPRTHPIMGVNTGAP